MTGKLLVGIIVLSAIIAGGALYYLQVYGYYTEVAAAPGEDVELVSLASGAPEPILYENFRAIDADSSPIRYRACFDTSMSLAMLTETYEMVEGIEPRNAPGWFDCFDAGQIEAQLEAGTALTFLGQKNVHYGVDRIVAITEDGHGYVWHELNDCGEKNYEGTVVGEDCPPHEAATQ
ncbi:DUF6446 family protein [Albibacillus kandeliae]|uniref:DUF6446 family protein n=1 Tax=Albibacillus kandeliae TaxID=2174228 RepID=UPI000D6A04F0|nr:DUF6446 family protein [Albibacillus kandeliae]